MLGADGKEIQSDWPTAYLYQDTGGKWFKSDERLTHEINSHAFIGKPFETNGRAFYPQWPEPDFKSQTRVAWRINADGDREARWCWQIVAHKKSHGKCKQLGNGKCAVKVLLLLQWDIKKKLWILADNPDAADKSQIKQINAV